MNAILRKGPAEIAGGAAALAGLGLAAALLHPLALWLLFAAVGTAAALALAFRFPTPATLAWLLLVGITPEMWLGDLLGAGTTITAIVKLAGLTIAGLCLLRYGPALDLFNPGLAFLAMLGASLVHGRLAGLDWSESLRSLVGSVAPFAFSFVRLRSGWARPVIRLTCWLPLLVVGFGLALAAAGVRPLFVADGGWRLAGPGHPAFLGGFALAALEASLLELLRDGRTGRLVLLGANMAILVLTGARAPLLIGTVVVALALVLVPSPRFGWRPRLTLALSCACLVPVLLAGASFLGEIRLFNMLSNEAGSLSGRDLIWPWFRDAWDASPWFGWGVGAGKVVVPEESNLARLLGTTAAHNEYLRMGVEGGWFGLAALVSLFVAWTVGHTRRIPRADRTMVRLVLLAFAAHAYTDNTLIATTSLVLFAWVSAVFARGAEEAEALAHSSVPRLALRG